MAQEDTAVDLAAIPWRTTRYPGIAVHFYSSNKRTGRVVVLIRMDAGCGYPTHRHKGREEVVVLEGAYEDELGEHPQGTFVTYEDRTIHSPKATADGPCTLLAVAHEGIKLL